MQRNVLLGPKVWLRVGGPAERFAQPVDENELAFLLKEHGPATVLGCGSNVLVRDGGIAGTVVSLLRTFRQISQPTPDTVLVQAGVLNSTLCAWAAERGVANFAFLTGIPGSMGGAVRMNAGCHGRQTGDTLLSVRAMDSEGAVHVLQKADLGFAYRTMALPADWIVLSALFQAYCAPLHEISATMAGFMAHRALHQPVSERTCGSLFKNPPEGSAWRLIDAAGCRGWTEGDACISTKHANFLVNTGKATAAQIEALILRVQTRVFANSGVFLDPEVQVIGRSSALLKESFPPASQMS